MAGSRRIAATYFAFGTCSYVGSYCCYRLLKLQHLRCASEFESVSLTKSQSNHRVKLGSSTTNPSKCYSSPSQNAPYHKLPHLRFFMDVSVSSMIQSFLWRGAVRLLFSAQRERVGGVALATNGNGAKCYNELQQGRETRMDMYCAWQPIAQNVTMSVSCEYFGR